MEASVRFIAPTTYCSKLGVPLCFPPYLEIMQLKKKKKNPKQTKKQHRAGTKGLFTHQHLEILANTFFFLNLFFFFKVTFLSLTTTPPQKKKKENNKKRVFQHP